jgi:hypothetical protein
VVVTGGPTDSELDELTELELVEEDEDEELAGFE